MNQIKLTRQFSIALVICLFSHLSNIAQAENSQQPNKPSTTLNQELVSLVAPSPEIEHKNHQTDNPTVNEWAFLYPYVAKYDVISDSDSLGTAERSLSQLKGNWTLISKASVSKYFIKLKSFELSQFTIEDNQLKTQEFESSTKISFKREKKMNQVFDWETGLEHGSRENKNWILTHKTLAYDRVSHLIQLRSDLLKERRKFTYNVSYKGKLQEYEYTVIGKEILSTKMGPLDTIKLSRTKTNGDVFSVWMGPALNYFPVQIAQYEEGKPDIIMLLESLEYITTPNEQTNQSVN